PAGTGDKCRQKELCRSLAIPMGLSGRKQGLTAFPQHEKSPVIFPDAMRRQARRQIAQNWSFP
ncbi:MAG: hypothetical protein AB1664_23575, partial [Thermodesulfobacteriota bacterium]